MIHSSIMDIIFKQTKQGATLPEETKAKMKGPKSGLKSQSNPKLPKQPIMETISKI